MNLGHCNYMLVSKISAYIKYNVYCGRYALYTALKTHNKK